MTSPSRVDYLDGLRAVAIAAVLGVHWAALYIGIGSGGYLGVDVFFVLSGYVITTVLWRSSSSGTVGSRWRTFIWRRVRRLYPALLALVVLTPIAIAVTPDPPVDVRDTVERGALAAVQLTWLPEVFGHSMEPYRQTWSLAMEWYFYLLWPAVVLAARSRGLAARTLARHSVVAAVVLYAAMLPWSGRVFYGTPPARFAEILAGAALALALVDRTTERPGGRASNLLATTALLAIGVYVLLAPWGYLETPVRYVGVPLAVAATLVLVLHGLTSGTSPVKRLLTWAPVTLLGRVSYSLYLWHWLPLYLLDKDSIDLPVGLLAVLGVGLTVILTTVSYLLLERPFMSSQASKLRARPQEANA
ncbi:unannotated protein [freshwater metagenome]|uniref:Unannotated protein n=1 Tax=freshwater metagenome TaxID=449393 RepID=A0A6J6NUW3_9ZZZZ